MILRPVVLALILACSPHPAPAQEPGGREVPRSRPEWSLGRTMREFRRAYLPHGFFPARGTWAWVRTTRGGASRGHVETWRFSGAQTAWAMEEGPLCTVFPHGALGQWATGMVDYDEAEAGPWRQVSATRYVAPSRGGARSSLFVEWRREDGRWVVSSLGVRENGRPRQGQRYGDEAVRGPRAPLRLPLPDTARVAEGQPWYINNEPITVGQRIVKYGLPRQLGETDVVRWGTLNGVGVYTEPGTPCVPEVVYLPVDRNGSFQPYQNER